MAASFYPTVASAPPQQSLSCKSMTYSGLKLHSATPFGTAKPNTNVDFFKKVHLSIQRGTCSLKPTRGQYKMMPIGTPMIPYKTPGEGTLQWVDLWNVLYRERCIFIGEHVDEEQSNKILATMLYLDTVEDNRTLYIYINCAGGDVTPTLAIYDTLRSLKSPIGTFLIGQAINLMGFILAAGHKGKRHAMPLATVALKSPATYARGQADDVINESKELLRISEYLYSELSKMTGQPIDKVRKDLRFRNTKFFTAPEAIEYGIIDQIARPPSVKELDKSGKAGSGLG